MIRVESFKVSVNRVFFTHIWKESESDNHSVMYDSLQPHGLCLPWDSPGQNTGVGSLSLLQGTFPTQGLNPGLPHYRWTLYQLNHKGSPRILERVAYPFCSGPSDPGIEPGSPALQADSLPTELWGKPYTYVYIATKVATCEKIL